MTNAAAIIVNGVVVNCVVATSDEADEAFFKSQYGDDAIIYFYDSASSNFGPGYLFADGVFTPPPRPAEDILFDNTNKYNSNMRMATDKITHLTDLTDPELVDEVDPADVELLKAWKRYRLALMKVIDLQNPVWPVMPA